MLLFFNNKFKNQLNLLFSPISHLLKSEQKQLLSIEKHHWTIKNQIPVPNSREIITEMTVTNNGLSYSVGESCYTTNKKK
jgi:hypothetical protein